MKKIIFFLLCIFLIIYTFYHYKENLELLPLEKNNVNQVYTFMNKSTLPKRVDRYQNTYSCDGYQYCYNGTLQNKDLLGNINDLDNGEEYKHGISYSFYDNSNQRVNIEDYNMNPRKNSEMKNSSKTRDVYYDIYNKCNTNYPWHLDLSSSTTYDTITKPICSSDGDIDRYNACYNKKNICPDYYISDSGFIIDLSSDISSFNENSILNNNYGNYSGISYDKELSYNIYNTSDNITNQSIGRNVGNSHSCRTVQEKRNFTKNERVEKWVTEYYNEPYQKIKREIKPYKVIERVRQPYKVKKTYRAWRKTKRGWRRRKVRKTITKYRWVNIKKTRYRWVNTKKNGTRRKSRRKKIWVTKPVIYSKTFDVEKCEPYDISTCKNECTDYDYFALDNLYDKPMCYCLDKVNAERENNSTCENGNLCIYKNYYDIKINGKTSEHCNYDPNEKKWKFRDIDTYDINSQPYEDVSNIKTSCRQENCETNYYTYNGNDLSQCFQYEAEASYHFDNIYYKEKNYKKYPFNKKPVNPINSSYLEQEYISDQLKENDIVYMKNMISYDLSYCDESKPFKNSDNKCFETIEEAQNEKIEYTLAGIQDNMCSLKNYGDVLCDNIYKKNFSEKTMLYNPLTNNFMGDLSYGDYGHIECTGGMMTKCTNGFPYVKNDRGEFVLDVKLDPIQRDKLPVYKKPHNFMEQVIQHNMIQSYNKNTNSDYIRCKQDYNKDKPTTNMCPEYLPICEKYDKDYGLCSPDKPKLKRSEPNNIVNHELLSNVKSLDEMSQKFQVNQFTKKNEINFNQDYTLKSNEDTSLYCETSYDELNPHKSMCPYNTPYCQIDPQTNKGTCRNNNEVYKRPGLMK